MSETPYKVTTFKIPKGTKMPYFVKNPQTKKIETHYYIYEYDMMAISGECSICHQFPCEHTEFVMNPEWQEEQKKKVLGVENESC